MRTRQNQNTQDCADSLGRSAYRTAPCCPSGRRVEICTGWLVKASPPVAMPGLAAEGIGHPDVSAANVMVAVQLVVPGETANHCLGDLVTRIGWYRGIQSP